MDFSISSSHPALDTVGRPEKLDNPVQNWTSGRPSDQLVAKLVASAALPGHADSEYAIILAL